MVQCLEQVAFVGPSDVRTGTTGRPVSMPDKNIAYTAYMSQVHAPRVQTTQIYMLKLHIHIGALSGYRPINGIFRSLIRLLLTFRIIAHANLEPGLISNLTFFAPKTFIAEEDP